MVIVVIGIRLSGRGEPPRRGAYRLIPCTFRLHRSGLKRARSFDMRGGILVANSATIAPVLVVMHGTRQPQIEMQHFARAHFLASVKLMVRSAVYVLELLKTAGCGHRTGTCWQETAAWVDQA